MSDNTLFNKPLYIYTSNYSYFRMATFENTISPATTTSSSASSAYIPVFATTITSSPFSSSIPVKSTYLDTGAYFFTPTPSPAAHLLEVLPQDRRWSAFVTLSHSFDRMVSLSEGLGVQTMLRYVLLPIMYSLVPDYVHNSSLYLAY